MAIFDADAPTISDYNDEDNPHLEQHRISDLPPSMYYIPNFISAEEEEYLLSKIPSNKWITLSHRRLQAVPAQLTANSALVTSTSLPSWLTDPICTRFDQLEIFRGAPHGVNHCLINEYEPGQGIMPHEDGAAYHPVVATVSLGGAIVLDVSGKKLIANLAGTAPAMSEDLLTRWRILQEPRSLLVTTSAAYTDPLHGIAEVKEDVDLNADTVANWDLLGDSTPFQRNGGRNERTTRVSLTYRDVKKVSNVATKIFGKAKT